MLGKFVHVQSFQRSATSSVLLLLLSYIIIICGQLFQQSMDEPGGCSEGLDEFRFFF